jgi:hypothetical protein
MIPADGVLTVSMRDRQVMCIVRLPR